MAKRSPADTRERLLLAGQALAQRLGVKRLTVRAVAAEAGANLGSFVHHFGTRDAFIAELIERWYAPMFDSLNLAAHGGQAPLQALRSVLLQLVGWLLQHRDFIAQLLLDAAAGEPAAQRFMCSIDTRHPALLLSLITQAQAAGELRRGEPAHQMLFLMSTLALPVLALHLLARDGVAPPQMARALAALALDAAEAERRLGWALRGLAPQAEDETEERVA